MEFMFAKVTKNKIRIAERYGRIYYIYVLKKIRVP